jgi:N-acetylneuraminic acid mutarotase
MRSARTPNRSAIAPASGRARKRRRTFPAMRTFCVLAAAASLTSLSLAGFATSASAGVTHSRSASASATARAHQQAAEALPLAHGVTGTHPTRLACPRATRIGYASCFSIVRTDVQGHKGLFRPGFTPSGYGPSDLQSAYSLPSSADGTGETVAVVDAYDNPNAASDLAVYRAQYGLPACTTASGCFTRVSQTGSTSKFPPTDPTGGWEVEESLDVDMVSAVCPNCHIILVEANNNSLINLGKAVDEAVKLGAQYVSNSYGGSESPEETTWDTKYYQHAGTVVTASSGDDGYGTQYPAASQYVTAVGGTTLNQDPSVPRGWTETAWSGTGSGCSFYEPKPSWQHDSGCANRTEVDVSADADPNTGVAFYDTFDESGWGVVGGTSVASPVIASTYALAGKPVAGTYPSSYPYADTSALYNITSGSNGTCSPAYLCTAGPGYNGPTGWGTPDGVAAFTTGPHGVVAGSVTSASGSPLSGAKVDVGTNATLTNSSGDYSITVPVGSYTVTATDFGYVEQTESDVTVSNGQTTTENFTLQQAPSVTLTGTVLDGSGQGWPVYAQVSAAGTPAATYTNPATGQYQLTLPDNAAYNVQVTPYYPGYESAQANVTVGTSSLSQNFNVLVDSSTCDAPGYKVQSGKCGPLSGGLVEGTVSDGNTGAGVDGATVTSVSDTSVTAVTAATNDPAVGDGFYFLFSPNTGSQQFTASMANYTSESATVNVAPHWTTTADITLQAGQLSVSPGSLTVTERMGQSQSEPVKFTDTGKEPVSVKLYQQPGSFTLLGQNQSTPVERINGTFSPLSAVSSDAALRHRADKAALRASKAGSDAQPAETPWVNIANYPESIMDNAVATDTVTGLVYSVGGFNGSAIISSGYVYNPSTQTWTALPDMQNAREAPSAAFINGNLYVTGGWGSDGEPVPVLEIYNPTTNTWSTGASEPTALAGASVTVYNGDMYVIGGCDAVSCGYTNVQIYDPSTNTWSSGAPYPTPIAWEGCGALTGNIYCAGGTVSSDADTSAAWEYSPSSNSWSSIASIPIDLWAMGYIGANGDLLVSGGVTNGFETVTNQGFAYDPSTNSWTALPNSNNTDYRAGSGCGFYRIGGSTGGFSPQDFAEQLPGYSSCGVTKVPWLKENRTTFTVNPGQSVTVSVTMNAANKTVTQPGTYTASLAIGQNTPYAVPQVDTTMVANPPATWGEIAGTVTGLVCKAPSTPLAGATVQINTWATSYTLKTDTNGGYALWLDTRNNPLNLIVALNGWQPQTRTVKIERLKTVKANFALKNDSPC